MNEFLFLVPLSIAMGVVGLVSFLWALKSDQYEDLDGAAFRVLEDDDTPLQTKLDTPKDPPKNQALD